MKKFEFGRVNVLLSLQRALLGEVFPALRAVTVEWSDTSVKFFAYVDGEVQEEDEESISCVATEVTADFPAEVDVSWEVIRRDAPASTQDGRITVYLRREPGD